MESIEPIARDLPRHQQQIFKFDLTYQIKKKILENSEQYKKSGKKDFYLRAIKDFFKETFYDEWLKHEQFDDWEEKCSLTTYKVKFWKYNFDKKSEDFENEALVRKKSIIRELKLTLEEKQILDDMALCLHEISISPITDAIKWFVKEYYPDEFEKFEKFGDWIRCSIKRVTLSNRVRILKKKGNICKHLIYLYSKFLFCSR